MTEETQKTPKINSNTIENIKKELIERKTQILKDLKDIENKESGKVKFPEYGEKADENAQEIGEYSTNLMQDKVLQSTLKDIDSSIERIENNSYGICKYCNEPISEKRLIARPVASACIQCKTKLQNAV